MSQRLQIPGSGPPMSGYDICCVCFIVQLTNDAHTLEPTQVLYYLSDIDECLQTPNPCAYQCRNVPGSFRCLCPPGTVLLGDGRSCAGLERGQTFANGTRVRARLRPQLVSSQGRPILSRSHGVSRITRQSCPVGYTNRDGTCVGEYASKVHAYSIQKQRGIKCPHYITLSCQPLMSHTYIPTMFCAQMWMSVCSGSPVNTSAETPLAVSSACVPKVTSCYPMAGAVKVRASVNSVLNAPLPPFL